MYFRNAIDLAGDAACDASGVDEDAASLHLR
jgi:hypothetical protein